MQNNSLEKIAFFFGSFNPVHLGHLAIADFLVCELGFEEIFFVLSPLSPDKKNIRKELLELDKRKAFLELALKRNSRFKLDLREARQKKKNFYTIDSVREIREEFKFKKNEKTNLLIGSDNFFNLEHWYLSKELKESCRFWVFSRNLEAKEKLQKLKTNKFSLDFFQELSWNLIKAPVLEISASLIRKNKENNKSYRYFLPQEVYQQF